MQKTLKILVADDEAAITQLIAYNLLKEGYEVHIADNGVDALQKAKMYLPQLIILDLNMPFKNGLEVCGLLRSNNIYDNTLIVFLTANTSEEVHIEGLELGADDFLIKPISPKVLVAKVNNLLRRKLEVETDNQTEQLVYNKITINPSEYLVYVQQVPKQLARKEFELLYLLAQKPGRVFNRNEILDKVWGEEVIVGDRTIDVHIRKLRSKLGIDCITTIKGIGYKFEVN
jgi:two-component system, OmpR family, alkaline phosphatase synthesis response regulator PhoP